MTPTPEPADDDPATSIYPNLPNYAADDATFRRLVQEGIADIRAGRTVPFEQVEAELRAIIQGGPQEPAADE